jgi:hypothetical protein
MKKILAVLTALIMMTAVAAIPAFADVTRSIDDSNIAYKDYTENSPLITDNIPVYGYVGEDAEITDTDPTNPDTPPGTNAYEINVSVPVKILWAAFESDAGAVSAPDYHIKNNSRTYDLDVTLSSFLARVSAANEEVDPFLTLNITGTEMATAGVINAGGADYDNDTPFATVLQKNTSWTFSLSGMYSGVFTTAYTPSYDMVLEFAIR